MVIHMSIIVAAPGEPDDERQDDGKQVEYTGQQLRARHPETYAAVIELLAFGWSKQAVSDKLKVNWRTVKAIEMSRYPDLASARETLTRKVVALAFDGIDAVQTSIQAGKCTPLDLKFLIETTQTLSGEATQIIQVNHEFPALSEFSKGKQLDVRDVTPEHPEVLQDAA